MDTSGPGPHDADLVLGGIRRRTVQGTWGAGPGTLGQGSPSGGEGASSPSSARAWEAVSPVVIEAERKFN